MSVTETPAADLPGSEPSDTPSGPLLEVTDLHTAFRTESAVVRAVNGVDVNLERGTTLGVVGESGSGKSVLSRSIMGLLPSNAVLSGSVRFQGQELVGKSQRELRHIWGTQMAMVFQDPMTALNPVMRVGNQITEPLKLHLDMSRDAATATALKLLASVGIPEPERRLKQYAHELSGGMRQRVMIAIALACGPKLLLADEPTTALDVTVQAQILDLLADQQRERFMAMILVTHDLGVVAGRADDIAVMYAGQVVERASTATLFRSMRHPYTEALLRSIPRLDDASHTRLDAIAGRPPDLRQEIVGCPFAPRCPYAQDRCRAEDPPVTQEGDHSYRCWYPVDVQASSVLASRAAGTNEPIATVEPAAEVDGPVPPPPAERPPRRRAAPLTAEPAEDEPANDTAQED